MQENSLSIQEAAKRLKVSTKTLRRWEAKGILVPSRTSGAHRRYSEDQIQAYLSDPKAFRYNTSQSADPNITPSQSSQQEPESKAEDIPSEPLTADDPTIQPTLSVPEESDRSSQPQEPKKPIQKSFTPFVVPAQVDIPEELKTEKEEIPRKSPAYEADLNNNDTFGNRLSYLTLAAKDKFSTFNSLPKTTKYGFLTLLILFIFGTTFALFEDSKDNKIYTSASDQVLAASSRTLKGTFNVNVPAYFNDFVNIRNDITVDGTTTLNGDVFIQGERLEITSDVIAPNLVYSATAGNGISITGTQDLVIENTGVTSFQGQTGEVTLTAGSNVTITGTTISANVPSTDTFKTVSDGTNSFDASGNDTLTFLAGTGISLSTNTDDKEITINNTSTGTVTGVGDGLALSSGIVSVALLSAQSGSGSTSSFSGLEFIGASDELSLLQGCGNGEVLKFNTGTNVWECASDAGGASGIIIVEENDVQVTATAGTLDFLGSDFILGESPVGEINVSIDYPNSGITRDDQNETISGDWTFSSATPIAFSNASPSVAIAGGGSLLITDGSNTLLTIADGGTQANVTGINNLSAGGTITLGTVGTGVWNGTAIGSQYGGTGQDFSGDTGVPSISGGTWSVNATLGSSLGGTGQDFSGDTGVIAVSGGTFSALSQLTTSLGGLGADVSAAGAGEILYSTGVGAYDSLAAGSGGECLVSGGAGAPSWTTCPGSSTLNYWNQASGTLFPLNSTVDFLVGGQSTASAKFAVLNINGSRGTQTATLSGSLTLDASGSLQTTNNQTLTIGGNTTGDINFYNASNRFTSAGALTLSSTITANTTNTINGISISSGTITGGAWNGTAIGSQYGGTGQNFSTDTGVPSLNSGVWSVNATLAPSLGGTGQDTSGSTGVPYISTGTWSTEAQLSPARGGTGQDFSSATGVITVSTGTFSELAQLTTALGGLGADVSAVGAGEILYSTGVGAYDSLAAGNSGECLVSGGTASPVWTDCEAAAGTITYWDLTSGALNPKNTTLDFLVGGTSTGSAKFAVLGVNDDTPSASISASGGQALVLGYDGSIQTTLNQTLSIGGGDTGNLLLGKSGSQIVLPGYTGQNGILYATQTTGILTQATTSTPGECLISGASAPTWGPCDGSSSVNVWETLAGAIVPGNTSTDLLVGGNSTASARFAFIGVNDDAPVASISASGGQALVLGYDGSIQTTLNQTLTLGGGTTGNINFFNAATRLTSAGALTLAGTITANTTNTINGLSINAGTISSGTWNGDVIGTAYGGLGADVSAAGGGELLYSTGATTYGTLAAGNSGECLTSDGTNAPIWTDCEAATGITTYWDLFSGALTQKNTTLDLLIGGTSTESAKFALLNINAARGNQIASLSGNLVLDSAGSLQTTLNQTLTIGGSTTGDVLINSDGTNNVGIGTATPLSTLDVNGTVRVTNTSDATDYFTIQSGNSVTTLTRVTDGGTTGNVTIDNAGTLTSGNLIGTSSLTVSAFSTDGGLIYANGSGLFAQLTTGTDGQCLLANTGAAPEWGSCDGLASVNVWETLSGAIVPGNTTTDLLVGGRSTSSARFAFTGVNTDTPVASISASSGLALALGFNGTIETTLNQTLSIGGGNTGNLSLGQTGRSIVLPGYTGQNAVLFATQTTGILAQATTSTPGECLISGASAPTWGPCDASSFVNVWEIQEGAIIPGNATTDFIVGGTSTSSAKFAVLGVNEDTPVASISASGGQSLVLGYDGSIQTTLNQTLTLGGSDTGNINFFSDANILTSAGALTLAGTINANTTNTINGLSINAGTISSGTWNGDVIGTAYGGLGADVSAAGAGEILYSVNATTYGTLAAGNDGECLVSGGTASPSWTNCAGAVGEGASKWTISNGAITTIIPSLDLLLGGSTTESARFAFTGVATDAPVASISASNGNAISLSSNGTIETTLNQSLTLGSGSTGDIILGQSGRNIILPNFTGQNGILYGTQTTGVLAQATTSSQGLCLVSGASAPTWEDCAGAIGSGASKWNVSDGALSPIIPSLDLLLGGSSTASARFAFTGVATDAPIASISASGGQALVLGYDGSIQTTLNQTLTLGGGSTGDINFFSAVNSLTSTGNLTLAGTITANTTNTINGLSINAGTISSGTWNGDVIGTAYGGLGADVSAAGAGEILYSVNATTYGTLAAGNDGECLVSGGTASPSWTDCAGATGITTYWDLTNGALNPKNTTLDFLVGGTSTGSAKFAVLGVNDDTPVASISASGGQALILGYDGSIQTTLNQTLTLGGADTGNINFFSDANMLTSAGALTLAGTINANTTNTINGISISSGTITGGTWNGSVIGTAYGGLGADVSAAGAGEILYSVNATTYGTLAAGNSGECLVSGGTASPSWTDCAGATGISTYWDLVSGSLAQKNTTLDFLIGGVSSDSAKFAILGVNETRGSQTASISGNLVLDAAGSLQTTNNQSLTIGGATTGNILINPDGSDRIGIGTSTPLSTVDVNGTIRITNTSDPTDYLTITSGNTETTLSRITDGGTTGNVTINNSGTLTAANLVGSSLTIDAFTTDGGLVYTNGSGLFAQLGTGANDQCLKANTGAAPEWGSCDNSESVNVFSLTNGAIVPGNTTTDFLVGGTSTSSARFAVIGVNDDTPVASISASGGQSLVLGYDGSIQTTLNQTLTLGGAETGNINFFSDANVLTSSGSLTLAGTINANTTNTINGLSINAGTISSGTWNGDVIGTAYGGLGADVSAAGGGELLYSTGATTYGTLAAGNSGECLTSDGTNAPIWTDCEAATGITTYWDLTEGGLTPKNSTVDFLVGGTSSTSAKFALLNINGTRGNQVASLSGSLTLDTLASIGTTNNQTLTLGSGTTGNIHFFTGSNILTPSGSLTLAGTITANTTNTINGVSISSGTITGGAWNGTAIGSQYGGTGQNFSSDTGVPSLNSGTWSVNATLAPSLGGTGQDFSSDTGVISVNGGTFSALAQLTTALGGLGADVTAAGGGELLYSTGTTTYGSLAAGNSGECLVSDGTNAPIWTDCEAATGITTYWDLVSGALTPKNETYDLLLGGTSTASAKIGLINIESGVPTATISANSGDNASFFTGAGNLGTANSQTLTLGGASTGDIAILPRGGAGYLDLTGTQRIINASDNTDFLSIVSGNTETTFTRTTDGGTTGSVTINNSGTLTAENLVGTSSLTLSAFSTDGGLVYTNGSGLFAQLGTGTNDQCLKANTGAAPEWGSCDNAASVNVFSVANGAIIPGNETVDFLLGGVSTSSAKFAVLGINDARGSQIASLSGSLVLDNIASIQTTLNQTLTIGGNTTGVINIQPNADTTDYISITSDGTNLSLSTTDSSNLTINPSGTLQFYSSSNALDSSGNLTLAGDVNLSTGNYVGLTGSNGQITFTEAGATDTITLSTANLDLSNGLITNIGDANTDFTSGGGLNLAGSLAVNGDSITADGAILTINAAGAVDIQDNLTADSLTLDTGSLTFSGITTDITTGTDEDLALSPNGSGNIILTSDGNTGIYIGLLSNTPAPLSVSGGIGSNALAIFNQANSGDIFTASASGATKLSLSNSGELRFFDADASNIVGFKAPSDVTSDSIYEFPAAFPVGTYLLQSNTSGVLSWIDPGTLPNSDKWDTGNGAIYPKIAGVYDLLLGGTSTASAKFAITGINDDSPVATLSAIGSGLGLSIGYDGTIQTTLGQTLTIGGGSSGNIVLGQSGKSIQTPGYTTDGGIFYTDSNGVLAQTTTGGINQCLTSNGGGTPSWTACTNAATSPFESANGIITQLLPTQDFLLGGVSTDSAKFAFIGNNLARGNQTASFSGNLVLDAAGSLQTTNNQTLTIGGNTTGDINITPGTNLTSITGNLSVSDQITLEGFAIYWGSGDCNGTFCIDNTGRVRNPGNTIQLSHGVGDGSGGAIELDTDYDSGVSIYELGGSAPTTATLSVEGGIGSNALTILNQLNSGDIFTASSSGATRFRIANNGDITLYDDADATDYFTISNSGTNTTLTRVTDGGTLGNVTINSAGTLTAANLAGSSLTIDAFTTDGGLLYTNGSGLFAQLGTGSDDQCLIANTGSAPEWGSCDGVGFVNVWETLSGAIVQGNTTLDLLVGGVSTESAKFAILGVNDDTPVASLSASTGEGLALSYDGSVQTTLNRDLVLGGDTTGNIILSPLGNAGAILPGADNAISLGASSSARFQDLFLGPSSLHVQCLTGDGCSQNLDYSLSVNTASNALTIYGNDTSLFTFSEGGNFATVGDVTVGGTLRAATGGTATITVAASDSSERAQAQADYVATGTDDDATIETAIAALPATGGTVFLYSGTYSIGDAAGDGIDINEDNITIQGEGRSTILQRQGDTASNDGVITVGDGGATPKNGVSIQDIAIDGQKDTYTGTQNNGIYFDYAIRTTKIQNSWIYDNDGHGIWIDGTVTGSWDNIISGNDIRDNDESGIYMDDANTSIISNNTIITNDYNIRMDSTSGNVVTNNYLFGALTYGIYLVIGDTALIDGNVINNSVSSGIVNGASESVISNNKMSSNGGASNYHIDMGVTSDNSTVTGNIMTGGSGSGITVTGDKIGVTSNTISSVGVNGILISVGDNNSVVGNVINNVGASDDGIIISGGSDNNLISGNRINDDSGSRYGINIDSSTNDNNYLASNEITGAGFSSEINDAGTETAIQHADQFNIYNAVVGGLGATLRLTGGGGSGAQVALDLATYNPGANDVGSRILATDDGNFSAHIDFQSKLAGAATNSLLTRLRIENTGSVGIGTTSPDAQLHLTRPLSWGANGKALAIFDQIENQDIFTASASGTTKLSLSNAGELRFFDSDTSNYVGFKAPSDVTSDSIYEFPAAFPGGSYLLQSNTSGVLSWIDPGSLPNSDKWDSTLGTIYPKNALTLDLLIGGTSTASAKFAILGVNDDTPVATLSASTGEGLAISYDGNIQTTQGQTLSIGGGTSGELVLGQAGKNIILPGLTGQNGILYSQQTTGILSQATTGASGECLLSGASAPVWGTCPAGSGFTQWELANGAIYSGNTTLDLLIGGTSTSSAKFGFLNNNPGSGNPTLSIYSSDSSENLSLYHDGTDGYITSSTGTINIGSGTGAIFVQDELVNDTASNTGAVAVLDKLFVQNSETVALAVFDNLGAGDILAASASGTSRFAITTDGGIKLGTSVGSVGQCLMSGGIGAGSTWTDCPGGGLSAWDSSNGTIYPSNSTLDLLIGGTATTSAKFAFVNVDSGNPTLRIYDSSSTEYLSLFHDGTNANIQSTTGTINIGNGDGTVYLEADLINDTANNNGAVQISDKFFVQNGEDNVALAVFDNTGSGDILTASSSGTTRFTIDASGNIIGSGTLTGITGLTSSGTITFSGFSTDGGLLYTNGSGVLAQLGTGTDDQCLLANTGAAPEWGSCDGASSVNVWNLLSTGAIVPGNETADLLVGGVSSASAKFAVLGVNTDTPVASVSATASGLGLSIGYNGVIQTTRNQTLTLGGDTTGNIILNPGNGTTGTTTIAGVPLVDATRSLLQLGTTPIAGGDAGANGGTYLGVNAASNFDGDFINFQDNGTTRFRIQNDNGNNRAILILGDSTDCNNNTCIRPGVLQSGSNLLMESSNGGDVFIETDSQIFFQDDADNIFAQFDDLGTTGAFDISGTLTVGTADAFHVNALGAITSNTIFASGGSQGGNAALLVNQTGASTNDIFTASSSGTTRFTIGNAGQIGLGLSAGVPDFGSTGECLLSQGVGSGAVWGACDGASSVDVWEVLSGTAQLTNTTLDLLVGGVSTDSAKFAITNVNGARGTQVATLSGSLTLDAAGSIQTTKNQTLTIGGNTTGDIFVGPRNGAGSILPTLDDSVSLGASSTARFKDIFLGPGSLHLQCTVSDGCGQGLDYALGVNTTSGNFEVSLNGTNNPIFTITQDGQFGVGGQFVDGSTFTVIQETAGQTTYLDLVNNQNFGTSDPFAGIRFQTQNTSNSSWTTSYDTSTANLDGFAFDNEAGVIYAHDDDQFPVNIYRCAVSTDCNAGGDWTTYTHSTNAFQSMIYDPTNNALLAFTISFGDITVERCLTASGCDETGDWSSYTATPSTGILRPLIIGGTLYLLSADGETDNPEVAYCTLSSGCDAGGDWTTYSVSSIGGNNGVLSVTFDSTNSVIYAGTYQGFGDDVNIIRCDMSTSCDADGDWTESASITGGDDLGAAAFDPASNVVYFGSEQGTVYRCATSTGCDSDVDWSTYSIASEIWDLTYIDGVLYAGTGNNGIIYQCTPSGSSCDGAGDWSTSTDTGSTEIRSFGYDSTNNVLYSGSAADGVIYRLDLDFTPINLIYSTIESIATDTTDSVEDGAMLFNTLENGVLGEALRLLADKTASFAGNLALGGGARSISTTAMNTLTLGGTDTGNVVIDSGSGNLTLADFTTDGGLLYTNGSGVLAQLGTGTNDQCLLANTGAAPEWGSCDGASSVNVWNIANGAIVPGNTTTDLLIGGTATTSAKFAFINVSNGSDPTLRIFDSSSTQYLDLYHDGTNGFITSSTGTVNIGDGTGSIYLEDELVNDTLNNNGFLQVADKFFVQSAENGVALSIFDNTGTGDLFTASASGTTRFVIDNTGRVGIGNSTPIGMLDVTRPLSFGATGKALAIFNQIENQDIFTASASGATRFVISNSGSIISPAGAKWQPLSDSSTALGIANASGTSFVNFDTSNSRVGIGLNNPQFKLDITDSQASTASAMFTNSSTNSDADVLALKIGATSAGANNSFATFLNGNGEIIGKITGNGSGGVSYATTGIDFAEYYKKENISETFSAGDLVCLGTTGGVTRCSEDQTSILGIVSDRAGFVGGSHRANDPSYVLVGIVGQLEVKVTGTVKPGDKLTTSDLNGVAKVADTAGYVVGRALASHNSTEIGKVMVALGVMYTFPDMAIDTNGNINGAENAPDDVFDGIEEDKTGEGDLVAYGPDENPIEEEEASMSAKLEVLEKDMSTLLSDMHDMKDKLTQMETQSLTLTPFASSSGFVTSAENLMVYGSSTFNDVSIENLTIGTSMRITSNSIDTIGETLALQSLKQGAISIMADAVVVETDGTLKVNENAIFAKNVEVQGVLSAASIQGIENTISVSGSARFENASFETFEVEINSGTERLSDVLVRNDDSAGKVILKAGETEVTILNEKITEDTLIFITPNTYIPGQSLYVEEQIETTSFTVRLPEATTRDIEFNFLIIN